VVTCRTGYAKSQPVSTYQAQRRAAMGKPRRHQASRSSTSCSWRHPHTHLCSRAGRVYWLRSTTPAAGRNAPASDGQPLPLEQGSAQRGLRCARPEDRYVCSWRPVGTVRDARSPTSRGRRPAGIIAVHLRETTGCRRSPSPTAAERAAVHQRRQGDPLPRDRRGPYGRTACRRARRTSTRHQVIALIVADGGMVLSVTETATRAHAGEQFRCAGAAARGSSDPHERPQRRPGRRAAGRGQRRGQPSRRRHAGAHAGGRISILAGHAGREASAERGEKLVGSTDRLARQRRRGDEPPSDEDADSWARRLAQRMILAETG